jgi:hypothetical protein
LWRNVRKRSGWWIVHDVGVAVVVR